MECILVNGPFANAVKVMDVDGNERKPDEWGAFPVWSVIDRCIILCANRRYSEAEILYKEIKSSLSANMLFKRNVLSLGVFIYCKMKRAADASQLLDELQKIQEEEDHHLVDRTARSIAADPLTILARVESKGVELLP
ncbi:hypothetical protein OESDEN_13611 [Oesophagostomum dentatum]|uniref:Tetratricopeptide repeat protein n=1 Tax=Oesophagostomum dentatum TaxID=61180 RepID=A0A0B1SU05_OESDE|nr:hypothetical protein OESDEN_13611 [Oesophagostomum dentatum]